MPVLLGNGILIMNLNGINLIGLGFFGSIMYWRRRKLSRLIVTYARKTSTCY